MSEPRIDLSELCEHGYQWDGFGYAGCPDCDGFTQDEPDEEEE